MARLFNIYFTHDDVLHSAIVSVRSTTVPTEYILGNLDAGLHRLLPGNSIVSDVPGGLRFQNTAVRHSGPLMTSILKSLAEHLRADEPLR